MLASAAITRIRRNLQETQTTGAFSDTNLLGIINSEVKAAISKFWRIGHYLYLDNLVVRQTSLSLTEGDDDEEYYTISSLTSTAYVPSLMAWLGDNPTTFISPGFFFAHRQTEWGDAEQIERMTVRGGRLYFYKPSSSTMRVLYVKIPDDYEITDTIGFSDDVVLGYIIPKCCNEAKLQDIQSKLDIIIAEKWLGKANNYFADMAIAALPSMNPFKQIPRDVGYDNIQGGGRSVYSSSNNDERV